MLSLKTSQLFIRCAPSDLLIHATSRPENNEHQPLPIALGTPLLVIYIIVAPG